jgi:hypothetical protein
MAQSAPAKIDRPAIEAKLAVELKMAKDYYDACTDLYKRVIGDGEEPISRKGQPDPFVTEVLRAQLAATERYRLALDRCNKFLLVGKVPQEYEATE